MEISETNLIINHIENCLVNRDMTIVLIAGNSRAGKSTLSNEILDYFNEKNIYTQRIELDNWIISVDQRTEKMNVFDRFNASKIEEDFKVLTRGSTLQLDAYEAKSRGRTRIQKSISLIKKGVVIVEGVIALGLSSLVSYADIRIYVDIDESIRKERFIEFYTNKGLAINEIENTYLNRLEDEFKLIDSTKANANIIYKR
ncbi:uridine kinase family protein [Fusibacter ferrireducens]|uniref:Phosphoribulokinase/uridine kinase domain-containing protein n=1 Tax=Fusibacter ferrireducens TaxID=2785058 RepID=A0ABR9ZX57_9FIRM|nr:hypothetical protein [Fusibacter ferrireducens]MBF4694941.1 hypothetical protein [Fusibacter ferrireducens]